MLDFLIAVFLLTALCPNLNQLSGDGHCDFSRGFRIDVDADGSGDNVQLFLRKTIFLLQSPPDTGSLFLAADDTNISGFLFQYLGLNQLVGLQGLEPGTIRL